MGEILSIEGISSVRLHNKPERYDNLLRWNAPLKPEDCKITLTTKDGKKWRAKWEEVKP